MTTIHTHLPIIILNVNGVNSSIKRQRLVDGIIKQDQLFVAIRNASHSQRETMEKDIPGKWGPKH
jgi:hypothetical protein